MEPTSMYAEVIESLSRRGALTTRERDVLVLLVEGRSTEEIADAIGIKYETAKTHVARTLHKLGVRSRSGLAGVVLRTACALDRARSEEQRRLAPRADVNAPRNPLASAVRG